MEAFLHPLQGLAEFEEIKKALWRKLRNSQCFRMYGVPEGPSDVWTFRAFSISSDPCG